MNSNVEQCEVPRCVARRTGQVAGGQGIHELRLAQRRIGGVARDPHLGVPRWLARVGVLTGAVRSAAIALKWDQTSYRDGALVNSCLPDATGQAVSCARRGLDRSIIRSAICKKIILSLLIPGAGLIAACAPLKVDEMPPRAPRDFLLDIRAVADSNDLADIGNVGQRLRIELAARPETLVLDNSGTIVEGYAVEFEHKKMAKEYLSDNFHYGTFKSHGLDFARVRTSMWVNRAVICATPVDLMEVFGTLKPYRSPHSSSVTYSYDNSNDERNLTNFTFDDQGCLYRFSFVRNTERE